MPLEHPKPGRAREDLTVIELKTEHPYMYMLVRVVPESVIYVYTPTPWPFLIIFGGIFRAER